MLSDKVRTQAYRNALELNPRLLRGARVLDVGCGTGILSMFAARAGAAAVVGIDGSPQIARFARANVAANGLAAGAGGPIAIVASKVEKLAELPLPPQAQGTPQQQQRHNHTARHLQPGGAAQRGEAPAQQQAVSVPAKAPPEQQVDVLVSEWMGYALLFESMLGSVLYARDRWLRPGGAVLPDVARLYVAAGGEGATGLEFWHDVYGFRQACMEDVRDSLASDALRTALLRYVPARHVISEPASLHSFDLATMSADEQDFTAPFRLAANGSGKRECVGVVAVVAGACMRSRGRSGQQAGPQTCHAVVVWFDTLFSERFCAEHQVTLSTSPLSGTQTHWGHTVLLLKQPVLLAPADAAAAAAGGGAQRAAVALAGQLGMERSRQTHRRLNIVLRYAPQYVDGSAGQEEMVRYSISVA
ncbi:putative arginine N-methyltransferase 3 isoform B [Micractinium conductrix]|nr:putative arginine N-methyltransferase 3 isoform B [Micractinium conductrix]|eukprot:PSC76773.1 putative arginine N-methyltransferase 3 isoform B [Micractinium conductrix]